MIVATHLAVFERWFFAMSRRSFGIDLKTAGAGLAGLAMALALAGCSDTSSATSIVIASKDVGSQWPFTVSEVNVVCVPTAAIFITVGGRTYPLNGQAERHPDLYKDGQPGKLNDIWKVEPDISKLSPDARMPLDAVTRKAIEACTKAGKWEPSKG
jgi:hypothetical protein